MELNSILVQLESCLQTCMTYTIAECTVIKLLMMDRGTVETCRVSCQNKFVKFCASIWFYYKEICVIIYFLFWYINAFLTYVVTELLSNRFE
jgi:hypothetical protein